MLALPLHDRHITVKIDARDHQLDSVLLNAQKDSTKKPNRVLFLISQSGRKQLLHKKLEFLAVVRECLLLQRHVYL